MNTSDDTMEKIRPQPAFRPSIDLLIGSILALQIIIAVYGFAILPDTIPIHWGLNGQANGYGPKWLGTFLDPLISLGIYVLLRILTVTAPRLGGHEGAAANTRVWKTILVGIMLFMLIIQLSTLAQTLGAHFDAILVPMLAISALLIFLGNYMGKVRRNFWIGVRTPWTLTSSVVWERTHRLGGWLFVAVGLIGIPCSFVPALRIWGVIVPSIAVSIFLCIYSYVCYRNLPQSQHEPLPPPFGEEN